MAGRTSNISSGHMVDYYYSKDPLFSGNEKGGASQWLGEGAKEMGLTGKVDFEEMVNVAHGYSPDGETRLVGKGTGDQSHDKRAATDFAMTVSKSGSIAATFDDKLRADIAQVFVNTVEGVEKSGWIQARQTKDGVTEKVDAKMITMLSIHSASRSTKEDAQKGGLTVDPSIHGHACFMNMTKREDGSFSTLSNDEILNNQALIQQRIYNDVSHAELKNGYALTFKTTKEGLIHSEIKGIPQETISLFSTMHNAITNASEMRASLTEKFPGLNKFQIDEMVHLQTKAAKNKDLTGDQLKANMVDRQAVLGKDLKEMIKASTTGENLLEKASTEKLSASEITSLAILDVNKTESKFSLESVELNSLKLSMGQYSVKELEGARQEAIKSGELVLHGDKFTTPEMIKMEAGIASRVVEQKNIFEPLMSKEQISQSITSFEESKGFRLNDGQTSAVQLALGDGGRDRVCLIAGVGGAGKTTGFALVNEALTALENDNLKVFGMSNDGKGAAQLQHDSRIKSQTVASFLLKVDDPQDYQDRNKRELWVLDEASKTDTKQFSALLDKAELRNATICIVGDSDQGLAIGAGAPFREIERLGLAQQTAITEVMRQRLNPEGTNQYAIDAATAMREKKPEKALGILTEAGKLTVIADRDERMKFVSNLYVTANNQRETACLVETNKDRIDLLKIVRAEQQTAGQIDSRSYTYMSEHPINLKDGDNRFAGHYEAGNIVTLQKSMKISGVTFKAGSKFEVTGNDTEKHSISFAVNSDANNIKFVEGDRAKLNELKMDDATLTIDVLKNGDRMTLSEMVQVSVSEREQIMILKNNNTEKGIENGEKNGVRPTIENLNYDTGDVKLKMEDNSIIEVNLRDLPSTNGQVLSIEKSQGLTADETIGMLDNCNGNKGNVAMGRHRFDLHVVTADVENLQEHMSQAQFKSSTLDDYNEQEKPSIMSEINQTLDEVTQKLDAMIDKIEEQKNATLFDEPTATSELSETAEKIFETEQSLQQTAEQNHEQNQGQETGNGLDNEDDYEPEEKSLHQEYELSM